ncbi:MAG: hypothetical protein ABIF10_03330 [Candidatus Woesearchaeota archaeon]
MDIKQAKITILILASAILAISIVLDLTAPLDYEIFKIVKPITITQYSGFLSFAMLLWTIEHVFRALNKNQIAFLIIFAWLAVMATLFETLWSFSYWFAQFQVQTISGVLPADSETLDTLQYTPSTILSDFNLEQSRSLNRSAKRNTLFLAMSTYFVYFLTAFNKRKGPIDHTIQ